jgi:cell division protein FtsQ
MSKVPLKLPETRSWREIPQQVRPRAMSREGRRRLAMRGFRFALGTFAIGLVGWGAWEISSVLGESPSGMPAAAKSDRVRNLILVTDGVLDKTWLAKTLALPGDATLMGLDLIQLRSKVLADAQVSSASVIRNFPDTLTVRVSERSPVVRMMAQSGSESPRMFLVSRDGVCFEGTGFDPAMVATLPWIDGVRLIRRGSSFVPIENMSAVADLLASAKLEADALYATWQVISLARLGSDGLIQVHARGGMTVTFGTNEDYLRQIARLDAINASTDATRPLREVNLSLGSQVPVAYGTAAPSVAGPMDNPAQAPSTQPLIAIPEFANLPH